MSVGKPAVVSDYGGNPCVIQDGYNGYVTPTGDVEGIVDSINLLKNDMELYKRMSKAALFRYQSLFTVEKMVEDTEKIYRKLLKKQQFE
jgi:glycosyltransferase involved in cell wall biosynthesis